LNRSSVNGTSCREAFTCERRWLPLLALLAFVQPLDALAQTDSGTGNRGVVQLLNQVEALNADLNRLRGQIELLTNEISNAQKRQRDMYVDLDTRLRRIEQQSAAAKKDQETAAGLEARVRKLEQSAAERAAIPAPVASPTAAAVTPPAPAQPAQAATALAPASFSADDPAAVQRAYDNAYGNYRVGDYQGAIRGFEAFLKTYPRHSLAANAEYWIGESYFHLRDYRAAIDAQRKLLGGHPESSKVPDALLIIGSSEASLGNAAAAKTTFEELIAKHPGSESAEKAKGRLARLQ
jgi:tol-pal system protein YbgF